MGNNLIRGSESADISINHPKIAHAKLITSLDPLILKVSMPSDQTNYKKWKDLLHKHKHLEHDHLLLPLDHKFHAKGLCATTGDLEIDLPNYSVLLSEEITNRQSKHLSFTEGQLWYLLYALLSAKSYLKESAKAYPFDQIGDIRPQNVFISPKGQVKFVNLLSWPGEKINYAKTFDGVATYLAPEDYESLQLGKLNNESNHNSSEDFAIGLTLFSSALLIDNSDLYDLRDQKFDLDEAQKRINAFKINKSYSEILRALVGGLLIVNPSKRLAWSEVWNWIKKYEKNISQKKEFAVDQLPASLNQQLILFRSQVSKITPQQAKITLKSSNNKVGTFFSGQQTKIEAREVAKSPSGYYSPRKLTSSTGQKTKVFIQYKSPGKDSSEKNKEVKQIETVKKENTVESPKLKKKESESIKKQETSDLLDIEKLKQIKKESDKVIAQKSSEIKNQNNNSVVISKESTLKTESKPIPAILQTSQEISLKQSVQIVTKTTEQTAKSTNDQGLGKKTKLSPEKKRDFLDDIMQVNKVINQEQAKDYSKENKYLKVEDSYSKN